VPNNSRPPPIRNRLLAALPGEEYGRLLPHQESVPLPFMGVLHEGGEKNHPAANDLQQRRGFVPKPARKRG
jgi:hypothetical protein